MADLSPIKQAFAEEYNMPYAIKTPTPMVSEVLENKHGIDNPVVDLNTGGGPGGGGGNTNGNWMGFGAITGQITTQNGSPVSSEIFTVPTNKGAYITVYVSAINMASATIAAFVRSVLVRNTTDTLSIVDQVQDSFTMRDDDWEVTFSFNTTKVSLQVSAKSGQLVNWQFSASIIPTI